MLYLYNYFTKFFTISYSGSFQEAGVIQAANAFNCPLRVADLQPKELTAALSDSSAVNTSLFEVDTPQVLVQTVKMAEDGSQTLVVRLNEAFGGSVVAMLMSRLSFSDVQVCNGLEDADCDDLEVEVQAKTTDTGSEIVVEMSAFQIVSLRCSL
ncbi:alpha-mannosidase [Elysia marginata]|uniref:Alpha-mannosidase n=1 Tax=Elysia marginata TaxID=1093978 RepID=A0AAV4FZ89_9GAST|nr:alpha-mannosidase [Elysia marginata]